MRYLITRFYEIADPAAYDASGIQRVELTDVGVRLTFADGIPCDFVGDFAPDAFSSFGIRLGGGIIPEPAQP